MMVASLNKLLEAFSTAVIIWKGGKDENFTIADGRRVREEVCEQRREGEVSGKKSLDLYSAVKRRWKKEKYMDNLVDKREARLKFRF